MENQFWNDKISDIKNKMVDFLPGLLISIFIFIIFYVIAEKIHTLIVKSHINKLSEQKNINLIYYQLSEITYYSIIIMGLIFALVNIGFNVATIITILGSVGLTLGLAFQETFKNIISSVWIGLNNLYSVGEVISIKSLGSSNILSGTVLDFDLYTTKILESNTNLISVIPNNTINNNIVSNITRSQYFSQS